MRIVPPIVANLLLVASALGFGESLGSLLPANLSRMDRVCVLLLGGLGILGILFFLVGMIHFSPAVILAILSPGFLGFLFFLRSETRGKDALAVPLGLPFIPAAIIAFVLAITFIGGLAEPVGDIKVDAIAYHYLGPRVWLRDAAVHVLPEECHTSFPATVEVLFAALMGIGGPRAPELFGLVAFGAILMIARGFALRLGLDPPGAWWATALVATMPVVYRGSYGGFNDAIWASFLLLALRFAFDGESPRHYVLAGILAGFAMGTKYTAIISFLLLLLCVFGFQLLRRKTEVVSLLKSALLMAGVSAVIASPWYLRNWIILGSPIYPPPPVLLHLFQAKYMSPEALQALAVLIHKTEGAGMGRSFADFVLLPFHLTFHPANFLNGAGGVGLDLLALAPFGLLWRWRDPLVKVLAIFCFLQVLAWFVTEQEARFLIHVYVLLAAFAVYGWRYAIVHAPRFGRVLSGTAIACSILYGLIMMVGVRISDVHAAVSPQYEYQRKLQRTPYWDSFQFLNNDPSVKKVLILEPRVATFFLQKPYLRPVGRFGEQSIPEGNDINALAGRLSAYGITHILDVDFDDPDVGVHNDFRVPTGLPNLQLVYQRKDQRVYRVVPAEQHSNGLAPLP